MSTEYTGLCSQVVLHQQGCNFERLQLRDETALQLLPKFCYGLQLHPATSIPRQQLDTLDTGPRHLDTRAQTAFAFWFPETHVQAKSLHPCEQVLHQSYKMNNPLELVESI